MYTAFRVENGVFHADSYSINYQEWAVKGQRKSDLNWTTLYVANSEEKAEKAAYELWNDTTGYIPVYNKCGNGYGWSNVVK